MMLSSRTSGVGLSNRILGAVGRATGLAAWLLALGLVLHTAEGETLVNPPKGAPEKNKTVSEGVAGSTDKALEELKAELKRSLPSLKDIPIERCAGAVVAKLLTTSPPTNSDASFYSAKWQVEKVLWGVYAAETKIEYTLRSNPKAQAARAPVEGITYIVVSLPHIPHQAAHIFTFTPEKLREVQKQLKPLFGRPKNTPAMWDGGHIRHKDVPVFAQGKPEELEAALHEAERAAATADARPLPMQNPAGIRDCDTAMVATLLEMKPGAPHPLGGTVYESRWKVQRSLRGFGPGVATLYVLVRSDWGKDAPRCPTVGQTYILTCRDILTTYVDNVFPFTKGNLRAMEALVQGEPEDLQGEPNDVTKARQAERVRPLPSRKDISIGECASAVVGTLVEKRSQVINAEGYNSYWARWTISQTLREGLGSFSGIQMCFQEPPNAQLEREPVVDQTYILVSYPKIPGAAAHVFDYTEAKLSEVQGLLKEAKERAEAAVAAHPQAQAAPEVVQTAPDKSEQTQRNAAALPLPSRQDAPISECVGAVVAKLISTGAPGPDLAGSSKYEGHWQVVKVLRGAYPALTDLAFSVSSSLQDKTERKPTDGETYIVVSSPKDPQMAAHLLDFTADKLREVEGPLKPPPAEKKDGPEEGQRRPAAPELQAATLRSNPIGSCAGAVVATLLGEGVDNLGGFRLRIWSGAKWKVLRTLRGEYPPVTFMTFDDQGNPGEQTFLQPQIGQTYIVVSTPSNPARAAYIFPFTEEKAGEVEGLLKAAPEAVEKERAGDADLPLLRDRSVRLEACSGAFAGKLLSFGSAAPGIPGASLRQSRWQVETILRGDYSAVSTLTTTGRGMNNEPIVGQTYLVICHPDDPTHVSGIFPYTEHGLRGLQERLSSKHQPLAPVQPESTEPTLPLDRALDITKSRGVLAAKLLDMGPMPTPGSGRQAYWSRWQAIRILRGGYEDVLPLTVFVRSLPEGRRERLPVIGQEYVLICKSDDQNQVADIFDFTPQNMRLVEGLVKYPALEPDKSFPPPKMPLLLHDHGFSVGGCAGAFVATLRREEESLSALCWQVRRTLRGAYPEVVRTTVRYRYKDGRGLPQRWPCEGETFIIISRPDSAIEVAAILPFTEAGVRQVEDLLKTPPGETNNRQPPAVKPPLPTQKDFPIEECSGAVVAKLLDSGPADGRDPNGGSHVSRWQVLKALKGDYPEETLFHVHLDHGSGPNSQRHPSAGQTYILTCYPQDKRLVGDVFEFSEEKLREVQGLLGPGDRPGPRRPLPFDGSVAVENCSGVLVATLHDIGQQITLGHGTGRYPSRWKVVKTLRGEYPDVTNLNFYVHQPLFGPQERFPAIGQTYLLVCHPGVPDAVADVFEFSAEKLREIERRLKNPPKKVERPPPAGRELPLATNQETPIPAKCRGAVVARLNSISFYPHPLSDVSEYYGKWEVLKTLRGRNPATVEIAYPLENWPEVPRLREPTVGETYIVLTDRPRGAAHIFEFTEEKLREVEELLKAGSAESK